MVKNFIRKDVYITKEQSESLEAIGGPVTQHIRNAIDDYLKKYEKTKIGFSKSSSKGGVSNG